MNKQALTAAAIGAATTAVIVIAPMDSTRRTQVMLEPTHPGSTEFVGQEVPMGEIENALALARVTEKVVRVRPFMGVGAKVPIQNRVVCWDVELESGKVIRLQLRGYMRMKPGETIEQARERFNKAAD